MYIKNISLKNYRNYENENISFSPNLNIIIGENAQGKTNLVEAIYVLGFGKSFRTNNDNELIKMDTEFTHIKVNLKKINEDLLIEFKCNNKKKKEIKINELPLKKISELMGEFNIVIFSPEDLQLVNGSPNARRKYLDKSISQIYPNYYHLLIDYNKILKQRNILLKQILFKSSNKDMIDIWDEKLSEYGAKIMVYRLKFVKKLQKICFDIHYKISNCKEQLKIDYISTYLPKNLDAKDCYDKIYSGMLNNLKLKLSIDLKRGFTSIGPHRDDLVLFINNIEIRKYGSQGQVRTTALSLKLSEINIIKESVEDSPILILDDVLSELDHIRQNHLIEYISNIQTFITTTEINSVLEENIMNSQVIDIHNGKIIKI